MKSKAQRQSERERGKCTVFQRCTAKPTIDNNKWIISWHFCTSQHWQKCLRRNACACFVFEYDFQAETLNNNRKSIKHLHSTADKKQPQLQSSRAPAHFVWWRRFFRRFMPCNHKSNFDRSLNTNSIYSQENCCVWIAGCCFHCRFLEGVALNNDLWKDETNFADTNWPSLWKKNHLNKAESIARRIASAPSKKIWFLSTRIPFHSVFDSGLSELVFLINFRYFIRHELMGMMLSQKQFSTHAVRAFYNFNDDFHIICQLKWQVFV